MGVLVLMAATPAGAQEWRERKCRYESLNGEPGHTQHEVRRTIGCAVQHWSVSGGLAQALCIARRESGLRARAENPTSSASGVYQMLDSTWRSWRFGALAPFARRMELSTNVFHARANVLIGIQAAHRWGWGPWGYAC
jgi:hypothetical protein